MANFKIMRNGLNTEIVGDPHIGQSSEDVTVTVTDDGTYSGYTKRLYYSYGYRNQIYRAIADENASNEFVIPMTAFLEPGIVKLSLELSNGTNKPTCNACFIIATAGAKSVAASDILPDDATWEQYVASYVKSHADILKGEKGDKGDTGAPGIPTDEQTQKAVNSWLTAHPEATTTVEDGSITEKKLADNSVTNSKLADNSVTSSKIESGSINLSKLHGNYEYAGRSSVDAVTEGKSLNSSTGAIIEKSGYYLSNDISVNGYSYLALGNSSSILACFYDSNGNFISSCTGNRFHYTSNSIPNNATTVRITNDNKLIKAVLTNYSFNISESPYLLNSGIFANPKSVNYGKFNVDRDIPKKFPDSSVPMTAIEGFNAKRYNYLTDRVDFFGENLNLLPILDTYYVYHFASGSKAGPSGRIVKIYEDGYVQEGVFNSFGYDFVDYTAITVSMPNDGTHGSCLCAYGEANYNSVLSDSKVTVISERDDLTEYHSYDDMYFDPSDNFKSLVKSSQGGKMKVYNGGLMITLGDSYTAMASRFFDSFASKHGLIQKNAGLASSKIARPEGAGQDTIKSFVTRLDELISSFPLTIDDKQYSLSDVKLITFMGGANDWTTVDDSKNIDRIGNKYSTDVGQLYGACKYIFGKLLSTFPISDLIVILQPNNSKSDGIDLAEMWTKETAVKECAEMYSLPICDCCFDFYSPANPNELNKYWQSDKLHLTHDGNAELFKKLESTLNTLSYYKVEKEEKI